MRLAIAVLATVIALVAAPVRAAIISGTYTISSPNNGSLNPFTAAFDVTFDNSADVHGGVVGVSGLPSGFAPGPAIFEYAKTLDILSITASVNGGSLFTSPGFVVDDFIVEIRHVSSSSPIVVDSYYSLNSGQVVSFRGGIATFSSATVNSIPEPASLGLLFISIMGLAFMRNFSRA